VLEAVLAAFLRLGRSELVEFHRSGAFRASPRAIRKTPRTRARCFYRVQL